MAKPVKSIRPSATVAATGDVHSPASNTAATRTLTPASGECVCISQIHWGYDGDPTGGALQIKIGSDYFFGPHPITSGGAGYTEFDPPMKFAKDAAPIITLAAGGSGISGHLSKVNWWSEPP